MLKNEKELLNELSGLNFRWIVEKKKVWHYLKDKLKKRRKAKKKEPPYKQRERQKRITTTTINKNKGKEKTKNTNCLSQPTSLTFVFVSPWMIASSSTENNILHNRR